MKILIPVVSFTYLTGAELYVYTLAAELVKRGHDVTICSFFIGHEILARALSAGIKVFKMPFDSSARNVPKEKYDIIASQEPDPTRWALNNFPGTPLVLTVHSEYDCEQPILEPEIGHYVYIRPSIKERWGLPDNRSSLVYNPIDFSRFNTEGVTDEGFLLFVGSVYYLRKEASLDILKRFPDTDIFFIGDKSPEEQSGGYLDNLRNPHVFWLPGINWGIEHFTKKCHATVGVTLGRTTIEGWACGKPGYMYGLDLDFHITGVQFCEPPEDMSIFKKENVVDQLEGIYKCMTS